VGSVAGAANPVPFVNQPLVPGAAVPGAPAFTLTVNGCMFVSGATVNWNGQPLATSFLSASQLAAQVPASDIATPSTASITVTNPGTTVASNVVFFQVTNPESMVYYEDAPGYPAEVTTPGAPDVASLSVVAGDFLNNGTQDLAFAGGGNNPLYNGLSVLLGKGDGTFTNLPLQPPPGLSAIAEGDFTGNGRLDLAVTNEGKNTVTIMLNNGDGTFTQAAGSPIPVGPAPIAIAVGDFNRDGKLDLAVVNSDLNSGASPPAGSVTVLLGNGDGTFTQAPGSPVLAGSILAGYAIAIGDFNGDGALDLAVTDYSAAVWILLGNGDGTFKKAPVDPVKAPDLFYTETIVAGDLNGDGKLDLAVTGLSPVHALNVLLGNGDGTFTPLPNCCGYGDGGPTRNDYMTMGDFNGDGKLDLAVLSMEQMISTPADFVQMFLGKGDGTFAPTDYAVVMNAPSAAIVNGDFNGSGTQGLVVLGGGPQVMWSFVQVANPTWPTPPDFTISAQRATLSVQAGGTVSETISIASQYGFYGEITGASCTGVPAKAWCMFAPSGFTTTFPQMIFPTEVLLYTVTITTTAPAVASPSVSQFGPTALLKPWPATLRVTAVGLAFGLLIVLLWRKPAYARVFLLGVALSFFGSWSSCGGSPSSTPPPPTGGTPPGTYTITLSTNSPSGGGLAHSLAITLTVQ
jgi:hypothetical protein